MAALIAFLVLIAVVLALTSKRPDPNHVFMLDLVARMLPPDFDQQAQEASSRARSQLRRAA